MMSAVIADSHPESFWPFTELDLQRALYRQICAPRELSCPNVYIYGSNESDYISVTKAGYVDEYEIKLTRSDFRADFKKDRHERRLVLSPWKHWDMPPFGVRLPSTGVQFVGMAAQYPNRFWYVAPHGLIMTEDVPDYAGLIWLKPDERRIVVKHAPRLHRGKASPNVARIINKAAYWRYLNFWMYGRP